MLTGCDSSDPDVIDPVTVEFDFDSDNAGWTAGFVDYLEEQADAVEFEAGPRALPAPLSPASGLFHSGMNISDDLFMYFTKRVDGLEPDTDYIASFELEIATSYGEDCTFGVGAGVYVKTGASAIEPSAVVENDGMVRLNIDKGNQQNDGTNALLIGDIRNGLHGCSDEVPYDRETVEESSKTLTIRSDGEGQIWLLFGSESAFESPHEVYYTKLVVEFSPA